MIGIKICGITNIGDALSAVENGADALGFIFYRKSKRYICPATAKEVIRKLPADLAKIGVFVNGKGREVKEIARFCGLNFIQLHGDESFEYCGQFPASSLIKAFSPRREEDLLKLNSYPVRAILADAREPGTYGGTGKISDWNLSRKIRERQTLILAGGLNAENIEDAILAVRPHAVDINSGIEKGPGKKDHELMRRLIQIVREMDETLTNTRDVSGDLFRSVPCLF